MSPAAFSVGKSLAGEPAEVVTNFTPLAATRSTSRGSRMNSSGKLTPKGLLVSSFMRAISPRHWSTSPLDVSMTPRPPALETAEASWLRAIQPIGACMIGYFTPVWASTRFMGYFLFSLLAALAKSGRWRVAPEGSWLSSPLTHDPSGPSGHLPNFVGEESQGKFR